MSMDAENCPSCGNALVISGLRAKKKKLELVTGILLLLFLCTADASMIYGGHAEDKKHECYDKIEKINSSLIGQIYHTYQNIQEEGIIDMLDGKDPLVEEYKSWDQKENVALIVVLSSAAAFVLTIFVFAIVNINISSKLKKYLKSVVVIEPVMNVSNPVRSADMALQSGAVCRYCGNRMSPGALFCAKCGNKT